MFIMVRRLIAVALVVVAVALPACAQRGGGRGGGGGGRGGGGSFSGSRGGLSGYSAPAFRASVASAGRANFATAPQYRATPNARVAPNLRVAAPPVAARGYGPRPGRYRLPYLPTYALGVPYGLGYYGPGYFGSGYLGYDDGYYDNSAYAGPVAPAYYPPDDSGAPPTEQPEAAPGDAFRSAYRSAQPQAQPGPEDAVTLIFKDGRPAEQIHNYMLTRTMLYVQDAPRQQIPVDQLDLAATVKANNDAGVTFQLPEARR